MTKLNSYSAGGCDIFDWTGDVPVETQAEASRRPQEGLWDFASRRLGRRG